MVLTRCSPRLIVDNNLNGLCDVVGEQVGSEAMAEQMIWKMQFVSCIHKSLLEYIEQTQKKQRKIHAFTKQVQMFEGFKGEGMKVKM